VPFADRAEADRPIRLAILDDNPFVRLPDGDVRPRASLFHLFVEAVIRNGPFAPADYLVPVAELGADEPPPGLDAVDERCLRVVATRPFRGIADYMAHAPVMAASNWPLVRRTVGTADLVWIKAPASNAALVGLACRRARVPRFTWVAGSVRDVARSQARTGLSGAAARVAGVVYDGTTRLLERTGPSIRLDEEFFTSVVTPADIERTRSMPVDPVAPTDERPLRIAWAGRIAAEKGLDDLLAAVKSLEADGMPVRLSIIGDGPVRAVLEEQAAASGLDGRVRWHGYLADRSAYLDALRDADIFALPSRAEGVPKVLVEAMAAGLPLVAARVGAVPALLRGGERGRLVEPHDAAALATAIADLALDQSARVRLRNAGLDFAAAHTAEAQADRLVGWMRRSFPNLPWPAEHPR
jgi:glycosyltransferase involved in cell wall biosynthesis